MGTDNSKRWDGFSQQSVTDWLHDVFFAIVRPPLRSPYRLQEVEVCAMNLNTFFRLLWYLRARHIPAHWIAEALQPLFDGQVRAVWALQCAFPQKQRGFAVCISIDAVLCDRHARVAPHA